MSNKDAGRICPQLAKTYEKYGRERQVFDASTSDESKPAMAGPILLPPVRETERNSEAYGVGAQRTGEMIGVIIKNRRGGRKVVGTYVGQKPLIRSVVTLQAKLNENAVVEKMVAAFKACGGEITVCEPGKKTPKSAIGKKKKK